MALNHPKMRRILDKYWRVPGRSLTSQWDGNEATLQAYFDEQGVSNATASEVIAKESDYDTFLAASIAKRDAQAVLEKHDAKGYTRAWETSVAPLVAAGTLPEYDQTIFDEKKAARAVVVG